MAIATKGGREPFRYLSPAQDIQLYIPPLTHMQIHFFSTWNLNVNTSLLICLLERIWAMRMENSKNRRYFYCLQVDIQGRKRKKQILDFIAKICNSAIQTARNLNLVNIVFRKNLGDKGYF